MKTSTSSSKPRVRKSPSIDGRSGSAAARQPLPWDLAVLARALAAETPSPGLQRKARAYLARPNQQQAAKLLLAARLSL